MGHFCDTWRMGCTSSHSWILYLQGKCPMPSNLCGYFLTNWWIFAILSMWAWLQWLLFVIHVSVVMAHRPSVIGVDTSDSVCWPRGSGQSCTMCIAQFKSVTQSTVKVGRPKIAGPGMFATHHCALICCAYSHLPWHLVDNWHTTTMSSVPYWVITLPLHVVSLVSDWHNWMWYNLCHLG